MNKKFVYLWGLLIFLVILSIGSNISQQNDNLTYDSSDKGTIVKDENPEKPRISKSWHNFTYIHIKNNWTRAKNLGWVSGSGVRGDPYVIENMTINAKGGSYGILIENSINHYFQIRNCTVFNTTGEIIVSGFHVVWGSIILANSMYGEIKDSHLHDNKAGIFLFNSSRNNITNNEIYDCDEGITIRGGWSMMNVLSYDNILIDNNMTNCGISVYFGLNEAVSTSIDTSNKVNNNDVYYYTNTSNLNNANFSNPGQILLINCNDSVISDIDISHTNLGLFLQNCINITLFNSNFSYNNYYAIRISSGTNISISNCQFEKNERCVALSMSQDCNVSKNTMTGQGIGIDLRDCFNCTIRENTMVECGVVYQDNYFIRGVENDIDTSNTINGKPLYYYKDKNYLNPNNFTEYGSAGQIILINCNHSVISNLDLSNGSCGITFQSCNNITVFNTLLSYNNDSGIIMSWSCTNITIKNCPIMHCGYGIYMGWNGYILNNITITDCKIVSNNYGLHIILLGDGIIKNCNISNNKYDGMRLGAQFYWVNSIIFNNTIANNGRYGLYLIEGYDSYIYNNTFRNNLLSNAYSMGTNYWNNSQTGNYWDDYPGKDTDDDGFGDSPYLIPGGSHYDEKPIFWDPPVFEVTLPLNYTLYGKNAPSFSGIVWEGIPDTQWYTLGSNLKKYNFTGIIFSDTINQTAWDAFGDGTVLIHFFVNDSRGYIRKVDAMVKKDLFVTTYGWIWMSGNKTTDENSTYGTKGVPDIANYPGARWDSFSWTDTNGNLWLFGGNGIDESAELGELNDLWRFNITTKEWAWMSGNKTRNVNGIYGTKGVPYIANYPGGRRGSVSWTDTDGNLWLFGGYGYPESGGIGYLNDLWRFNITSKEWAWIAGNKTIDVNGTYGTKGVPDIANYPGARGGSVSWTDTNGNLWLFGGYGYNDSAYGLLNDLWRFNITSKEWTWISGNKTTDENGIYGTKGVPDIANYPGARGLSVSWTDTDGNLWVFGGVGYNESAGSGFLNDLWRFNLTSKEWTWISGNKSLDENGVYGTKGVPDMANYPGGRMDSVSWTDTDGNLWVFGGWGHAESGDLGRLNDLWKFNITSKEWTWISGFKIKNQYGAYGTKGIPDIANYPGAREVFVSWTDTDGNLWLFGGFGYAESGFGFLNDLWIFKDSIAPYITIIEPSYNKMFNATAPSYNLTFIEAHLDDTWYRLWNGTQWSKNYTIPGIVSERTGQINQNAWNNCPNGTVIIEFYANDTSGNLRMNSTTVRKDILGPLITINDPAPNEIFSSTAPGLADCNVLFSDVSGIDAQWYMLINGTDNTDYTNNYTWNGEVDQFVWHYMDNGTVIIRIFANDSLGNIGMAEVTVRKDIIAPYITIIEPIYNKLFNATTPSYNLALIDAHLDDIWYRLWNGTEWSINYTIGGSGPLRSGQIDQNAWNDCPNGTVIIEFYANDTLGNLRMNSTMVRKDILGPTITINDPTPNELFFSVAPNIADFDIIFRDVSGIDARWYMLINGTDNTDYTNNYTWNDEVDQFVWDYMDNGTIIIRIFANDSLGYIGMAEVTVRKEIQLLIIGTTYGWTWMLGNKTIDEYGVYGTKGVPDRANYPGSRENSVSWTDTDGNFWLFGGEGYAESGGYGRLNDLWRFNITSKEWVWISGNKTTNENSTYGTKGVPDRANYPGGRAGSASWTDMDGNLWLLGGGGYDELGNSGCLNDLWRFNITSKEWTWISGNKTTWNYGVYGTMGVPDMANYPGARWISASWMDTNGDLWLFGGWGYAESFGSGTLNDLWRFDITSKEWTWISGTKTTYQNGVYGTKGVPDMANYPGGRMGSVSWTDTDGDLWLFGGFGNPELDFIGHLNDLWRFNITSNEWAWMSGNKTDDVYGVYGTKGIPDRANFPGAREGSVSWMDMDGNFWLFGGWGFAESGAWEYMNDLWRFNITSKEWVWLSGEKTIDEYGVYGTKGVPDFANYPGARSSSVSWTDTDGNFWLFGGEGYNESGGPGYLNDLWRFGKVKDSIAPNITIIEPSYNKLFNATAPSYNLALFDAHLDEIWYRLWNGTEWSINYTIGGSGPLRSGQIDQNAWNDCPNGTVIIEFYANDTLGNLRMNSTMVRKDILGPTITINDPTPNELFFSVAPNIADCDIIFRDVSGIDARWYMLINGTDNMDYTNNYTWNDEVDQFIWDYMDNGTVIIRIFANDSLGNIGMAEVTVRKDIGATYYWIWMSGNKTTDEYGVYGTKGVPDIANYPGARQISVSWTDTDGNLWLFGGNGLPESGGSGLMNDLWRFNIATKEWAWISGNNTRNATGVYGTKGVHDMANYPGARMQSVSWTDADGNLWLFGGWGYNDSGGPGWLNDLWRFNITSKEWAWMSGNKTFGVLGVYGTKGVPDVANYPGARWSSVSWTDTDGNLWLFGGYGFNDLWRFNITSKEWAWMAGNKTIDEYGVYGMKGVPDRANYPGARGSSVSWTDTDGNFWLFGGSGLAESGGGLLNDLWRFNITSKEWAWMSGNKTGNEYGVYGTKGDPDMANYPGGRGYSGAWTDTDGNLWLFGGEGLAESGLGSFLNDLWRFNITSMEWAWMAGNKTTDEYGVYGMKGVPDMASYPGARQVSGAWTDTDGNFWLFGGLSYNESVGLVALNDLWRFGRFKDSIAPYITIFEPMYNKLFNATAPSYNLTIIDGHLDDTWYRLWNGTEWSINYTIPGIGSERIGQINQGVWNNCPNGTVIIEFYANDTFGNLRRIFTTIRKDILGPIIVINAPTPNELFSSTAPALADCNVDFRDVSGIDAQWYMLINGTDNLDYTNNYTWNGEVDQFVWDYMDNGTVIIRIFANDSSGYIGMAEVIVRKDIDEPSPPDGELPPSDGDDDDDGKKPKEGFDFVEFLTSPIGLAIIGVSGGAVVAIVLFIRKRKRAYWKY